MFKKNSGIIFLLIAVACWGPGPVITKVALDEVPQLSFAFIGRVIALLILFFPFYKKGFPKIDKRDLPQFILAGLTGTVFNVGFFVFGIKMTNAMDAQAIFSAAPLITALFAYLMLSEKIKAIQLLGVVIGFSGAILIAAKDFFETGNFAPSNLYGNFLIFLSAVSFAAYILISRRLSHKYEPLTITCYSFLVSSVIFAPFALFDLLINPSWPASLGPMGVFGIFYVGVFASVIAFLSYQTGIRNTSAFAAGVVLYLQPIVTTGVASIFLHERITPPFIIGAALIILGSFIATQYRYRPRKREEEITVAA